MLVRKTITRQQGHLIRELPQLFACGILASEQFLIHSIAPDPADKCRSLRSPVKGPRSALAFGARARPGLTRRRRRD